MAVNSLYNIIDSFFVAKVSENAMTALSLVYPIQNLVNSIAVGFGVGINAVVAFSLTFATKKLSIILYSEFTAIDIIIGKAIESTSGSIFFSLINV